MSDFCQHWLSKCCVPCMARNRCTNDCYHVLSITVNNLQWNMHSIRCQQCPCLSKHQMVVFATHEMNNITLCDHMICFTGFLPGELTHCPLGDLDAILKMQFSTLFDWLVSSDLLMTVHPDECNGTSRMVSQHWFRLWLGAVRQQAITLANVHLVPCRRMASSGHTELIHHSNR